MIKALLELWDHVLYPVSNPSQVLAALGIQIKTRLKFRQFLRQIVTRSPRRLYRRMPRSEAEKVFMTAYKKEIFHHTTLISYCFCQGWLEFVLEFDPRDNLRRLYVQHRLLNSSQSIELELPEMEEKEVVTAYTVKDTSLSLTKRLLKKLAFSRR